MTVRVMSHIAGTGLAALAAMICVACWPPAGQAQETAVTRLERSFSRAQFAGWTGIVFRCVHDPHRTFDAHVCDAVTNDARAMAAAAKVPFTTASGQSSVAATYESAQTGGLIVEADISSSATSGFIGVALGIQAGNSYGSAVDRAAAPGTPEASPRGGTVVLWQKTGVACGLARPEFERAVAVRLADMFRTFFYLFVDSWRPPVRDRRARYSGTTAR